MSKYVDAWNGSQLIFNSPEEMNRCFRKRKISDYLYEYAWSGVVYKFKTESEISPFIAHLERRKKQTSRIIERVERRKKQAKELQEQQRKEAQDQDEAEAQHEDEDEAQHEDEAEHETE
jgi:hypothetical protein